MILLRIFPILVFFIVLKLEKKYVLEFMMEEDEEYLNNVDHFFFWAFRIIAAVFTVLVLLGLVLLFFWIFTGRGL